MTAFSVRKGFDERHRNLVAELFWGAFSGKLGKTMAPEEKAIKFFAMVADPSWAYSAVSESGQLLGVAGFKVREGAFIGGGFRELAAVYGFFSALPKLLLLGILEREIEPDVLLMDGIFVDADSRGIGVGSALLDAIVSEAERRNLKGVRLDVIDTNPDARRLYERKGFKSVATVKLPSFLKPLFGFSSATKMVRETTKPG